MMRASLCFLAALLACAAAYQPVAAQNRTKLSAKIESNEDKVPVKIHILEVTDPALGKDKFANGWGPTATDSIKGLEKLKDAMAIVVQWEVKKGQAMVPKGALPSLKGVRDIPKPYVGTPEQYDAVGFNLQSLTVTTQTPDFKKVLAAHAESDGVAEFLWVVSKNTKAFELKLGSHKPLRIAVEAAK